MDDPNYREGQQIQQTRTTNSQHIGRCLISRMSCKEPQLVGIVLKKEMMDGIKGLVALKSRFLL
jgi:hypothetical protein